MIFTEEQLREMSGYSTQAAIRKWVRRNGWRLLAPGKDGRVIAERVERTRHGTPNFAAIAEKRRAARE